MRRAALFLLPFLSATSLAGAVAPDRVTLPFGQRIFVSGINVAWDRFGGDVGSQPLDTAWFSTMLKDVSDSGGNAVRWWLFTNCSNAPVFDKSTKLVSGPGSATISNVRTMLDMAYKRGIVVSLCLLSFDMMKSGQVGADTLANQRLLLTDAGRQAFLQNALVPLVKAIGNHPAILDWEIFNEPEGMVKSIAGDWGSMSGLGVVQISDVQRMVNQAAGAIHRSVPGVLVSNGSWSFIASSNTLSGDHNYYSDSALKAVGQDPDGTLDFYMVHYYEWGGHAISPFHHPASYWGLDKPIVIGEFPAKGLSDTLGPMSPAQCFAHLHDNGYAGAMGWTYTAHDGFGGLPEDGQGTRFLKTNHAAAVSVDFPPTARDDWYADTAGKTLSVTAPGVLANDLEPTPGQSVSAGAVVVQPLAGTVVLSASGAFAYTPVAGFAGSDSFSYQVVGGGGATDTAVVRIRVIDPGLWFQAPPKAKDWKVYASWGTISVTDTPQGLAVHNAQWGSAWEWLVGTGAPVQAGSSMVSVRLEVRNDPASPWNALKFHLAKSANVGSQYGPSDTTVDTVTLSLLSTAPDGWQTFVGRLIPSGQGSYLPALELVWHDTDGNGPNNPHVTLLRDVEIATSASASTLRPPVHAAAWVVGNHLVLPASTGARSVSIALPSGRILLALVAPSTHTVLELPRSPGILLARIRESGKELVLTIPSARR